MKLNQLATYLEAKARAKTPVFYSEVVAHLGMEPLTEAWTNHPLASLFEQLDEQDANANRPFRTVMVISKEQNMPGPGFFKSLERLRGVVARNERRRTEIFIQEFAATTNYRWPVQAQE